MNAKTPKPARRERMAALGPCPIETVPIGDFGARRLSREQLQQIWHICGPSAEKNLERNPLWIAICMAYAEGLSHGAGLEAERALRGDGH